MTATKMDPFAEYDCEVCGRECDVLHEGELPLCSGCFGEVLRL